jgi:hypothetical protein
VLYAVSGAHSMDGLRGRQPPDINLFKSMTSPRFQPGFRLLRLLTFGDYILITTKTL